MHVFKKFWPVWKVFLSENVSWTRYYIFHKIFPHPHLPCFWIRNWFHIRRTGQKRQCHVEYDYDISVSNKKCKNNKILGSFWHFCPTTYILWNLIKFCSTEKHEVNLPKSHMYLIGLNFRGFFSCGVWVFFFR